MPEPAPVTGEPDYIEEPSFDYSAVESLPPGTALLVVLRGPNQGSRFLLDHDFTSSDHADIRRFGPIRYRSGGQGPLRFRNDRVCQSEVRRLSFCRQSALREHEGGRLHVRGRCD